MWELKELYAVVERYTGGHVIGTSIVQFAHDFISCSLRLVVYFQVGSVVLPSRFVLVF